MGTRTYPRYPHLPPGHEPGPQSRNRAADRPMGLIMMVLCGVAMIVIGIVGAANPWNDRTGPGTYIAFFCGIGVLLILWAAWLWRRTGVVRGAKSFEVGVSELETRRGGTVEAELSVKEPAAIGEELEVGLVCLELYEYESTRPVGDQTVRTSTTGSEVAYEEWKPASTSDPEQTFSFTVPAEAPFSHEGTLLSFAWSISARAPRALRADPTSDQPIWVAP